MNRRTIYSLIIGCCLMACKPAFQGVEGVKGNGSLKGGLPSKELRKDYDKLNKRQAKEYKKEMKKRHKKMGTKTPK